MSLFSFLRKNKQESASKGSAFYSRAEESSSAVRSRGRRKQGGQAGESLDSVLPEKKRARRRLIGAVALVLAAVIGLPMILDSEPKPLADDIAIRIPSKDKPAAAAGSGLSATPPASNVAVSASLDPREEVIEPATPPVAAATVKPGTVAEASGKPKENSKPAADAVKAAADTPNVQPRSNAMAAAKLADNVDETARAMALLEGMPDPKAAEKKPEKFVVQVAALATKEKIDELQAKLKNAGIKSYTQKVATQSGDRTRIRVGPFHSKEEAETVRAKIVKLGLNGTLVPV